ncbi:MAG TPA: hypothetical protein VH186_23505 [Chloroflexia bacterium]|nr:hypothetical protein [Chloroflexia bacterium]
MLSAAEAVALLTECKALADKILNAGPGLNLEKEDLIALEKFRQVKEAGFANNYDVQRLATLNTQQVQALNSLLQSLYGGKAFKSRKK